MRTRILLRRTEGCAQILRKIADEIEKNKDAIAEKEAVNAGKPLIEAAWDIDDVSGGSSFRGVADAAGRSSRNIDDV